MALNTKNLPEVFVSEEKITQAVSQMVKKGEARKIGPRLYTTNMVEPPERVIRRNLWLVVRALAPNTVVGFRTAFHAGPSEDGSVFVSGPYKREFKLAGLRIVVVEGPGLLEGDSPFVGLHISSEARSFLENLMPTKAKGNVTRAVGRAEIENKLVKILQVRGEDKLKELRDAARRVAPQLKAERELGILDDLIGSLLRTRPATLETPIAKAFALGEPYDPFCLERFEAVRRLLATEVLPFRPRTNMPPAFHNEGFFDAYFSNYIEGTEFPIEEAIGIVFRGQIPPNRPEDAHDVIGTYQVVGSLTEITEVPRDFQTFIRILQRRHAIIMGGRPEKRPGEWKEKTNQAGSSVFVAPELVGGTLKQGFSLYQSLTNPLARALFMMFFVSEIHPFDDGNGRVSRAMMNAELVAAGQCRIIIPSVFRNEYVSSLKRIKNHADPKSYLKVMLYAQEFVSRISFVDLEEAKAALSQGNAFKDPTDQVKLVMPATPPQPA